MTDPIDKDALRALAENIIAVDGPIWWIEQDFRAVRTVLDATVDAAKFVEAANPTAIIALLDHIAALEAKLAAAEGDAARYRWLRHGDNDEKVIKRGPVAADYVYLLRNEKLDAAIDACIAATKEPS